MANHNKNINLQVLCQKCKKNTKHSVLSALDAQGQEDVDGEHFRNWKETYQIIQCLDCETISFRSEYSDSDNYDLDGDPIIYKVIYPKRTEVTIRGYRSLPLNLHRIYREIIDCYNNDCLILCAGGVRALVDGICQDKKIISGIVEEWDEKSKKITQKRKGNLKGKINGLVEKGYITNEDAEALHACRVLGNGSLHELPMITHQQVSLAIKIIDHILDLLYEEIPSESFEIKRARIYKDAIELKQSGKLEEQKIVDEKSKEIQLPFEL